MSTMSDTPSVTLVGIDGGLRSLGVAVALVTLAGITFQRVEVFTTKPSSKRRRLRKCDDTAERMRLLAGRLDAMLVSARPVAVAVEAVALPFGRCRASVVSALGRVAGAIDALCVVHKLPCLVETPQAIKLAAAGAQNASKDAVRLALEAAYPELRSMWPTAALVEHAADAAAVVHACARDGVVLAALKARAA